ncbi:extracellular solute-binding protein [Arthrobacter sp. 24S4-2]|uniref:ABC transporter substrate-binding protein n=1 Tax=Arthrobacter sp. 24S4-2 TaxID=2575374 RepID=UPI0010C7CC63|nr:extracellular solute-binding protein [Arthrobacter sp. 24S4-2]QCO96841.1 extracellular solute-binding protein [Arthrobacter sp. 24S4-2]
MDSKIRFRARVAVALSIASAAALTGCAGGSSAPAATDDGQPIEVWARAGTDATTTYSAMFKEFTAKTGVQVNFQGVPDLDQQLQTRAASKKLPDIVINDSAALGNYTAQGYLQKIDKSSVTGNDRIADSLWKETEGLDGASYGVPFSRQTMVTMIRKDWREKLGLPVPKTLEDLAKLATAFATQDPDGNGQADTYGMAVPGSTERGYLGWWASSYIWQDGGSYLKDEGNGKYSSSASSPETRAGVSWIKQQFCTPGNTQPGALTAATSVASPFFQTGKAGIILTGPYNFSSFDKTPGKDAYEVVEAPKGSKDNTVLAEGENIYVTASNGKKDQTKQVIDYLVSEDGQKAGMTAGKQPIVRVPVNSDVDAAAVYKDPRWSVVQEALKSSSKAFPSAINFVPFRQAAAEALNKIVADCPADNVTSGLQALDTAINDELNSQNAKS